MYLHVVLMAFNQEVTASLSSRVEARFDVIARTCPGVMRFELLRNASRTSPDYSHALLSVFSSEEALDAYRVSPAHDELMAELGPYVRTIVVLDSVLPPERTG